MSHKQNVPGQKPLHSLLMQTSPIHNKLSRRQLIKTGIFGSAVLSISSGAASLSASTETQDQPAHVDGHPYPFLNKDDQVLITALLPVIIDLNWPKDAKDQQIATEKTLRSIDLYITRLGSFNAGEIRKLFDLLNFRMTRFLMAGIWSSWDKVDKKQVDGFLISWKLSRFSLLTGAYNALTDILAFCWYSNPENTSKLGYSGPPEYTLQALPQFKNT